MFERTLYWTALLLLTTIVACQFYMPSKSKSYGDRRGLALYCDWDPIVWCFDDEEVCVFSAEAIDPKGTCWIVIEELKE